MSNVYHVVMYQDTTSFSGLIYLSSVHFTPLFKAYSWYTTTHGHSRVRTATHTDARALTHRPADHRDLISRCHNTFIPHLFLGAVVNKRLLSAAKWQSGLLTVFFILSNGERWHGPRPSLSVALSKQG